MEQDTKKEISKSVFGAGLIAFALCCGPILLVLLAFSGVGGFLGLITGFLTKNIYFVIFGLISLGVAGWVIYNRRS
ncbi:MAG: hypothetical protein WD231_04460 [Candidatus Woykebacteria bacterium]